MSNTSTSFGCVEGIFVATQNTEVINLAVGAVETLTNLGRIKSKAVEVGATTFIGAGSDGASVPHATSLLVTLIGFVNLRAVFSEDSELGTNKGFRITDTVEDLVVDFRKEGVGVVVVGGRAGESHQPLLVLEIFLADLSSLVKENLSGEDLDTSRLEFGRGVASIKSIISLTVGENDDDLLATRDVGAVKERLGLAETRSHERSVRFSWLDVVFNVIVNIFKEFFLITRESSLGTIRGVGDDGSFSILEFNKTNTHTELEGRRATRNSSGEGSVPDPVLQESVESEPTVVRATNSTEDGVSDTIDDDNIKRSATNLEAAEATVSGVHPEATGVTRASTARGVRRARLEGASTLAVVGRGLPFAQVSVTTSSGARVVVRAVGDAAASGSDAVIPVASTVGTFASEFISPASASTFSTNSVAPFTESIIKAGLGVVVVADAFTALQSLGVTTNRPSDSTAVIEFASIFVSVGTELFTALLFTRDPFAVVGGVSCALGFGSVEAVTLAADWRIFSEVPLAETRRKSFAIVEVGDGARIFNALGSLGSTTVPLAVLSSSVLLNHTVLDVGESSALVEDALLVDVVPRASVVVIAGSRSAVFTDLAVAEIVSGRPFAAIARGVAATLSADGSTFGVATTRFLFGDGVVVGSRAVDLVEGGVEVALSASEVLVGSVGVGFTATKIRALSGVLALVERLPVAEGVTETHGLGGDVLAGHGNIHVHAGESETRFEVGGVGEVIDVLEHTRHETIKGLLHEVSRSRIRSEFSEGGGNLSRKPLLDVIAETNNKNLAVVAIEGRSNSTKS